MLQILGIMLILLLFSNHNCQENIIKGDCDLKPNTCFSVPSPPLNLRLNQLRQKQQDGKTLLLADMAWDPPENIHGRILAYTVKYRLLGPEYLVESLRKRSIPIPKYKTNVTTTNYCSTFADALGFGKLYEFTVAAINTNLDVGLEAKFNISTRETAPEMYPISIQFTGLSSRTVNISWQPPPPETQNGIIINYHVTYYLYGLKNTTSKSINSSRRFAKIESLQKNALYVFKIRACTKLGYGPWSPEINFRTADILPEPPVNIVAMRINSEQIKVNWELPKTQLFIKIVGFRIYYCVEDNNIDLKLKNKNMEECQSLDVGPITMATIGGLLFKSKYRIALKSRGIDNRYGRLSDVVEAPVPSNPQLIDMAVKSLSCTPLSESIEIRWSQPELIESLTKFVISIKSFNSYIKENGEQEEKTRSFNNREVDYDKDYTQFVIDLKDMIPNTVYDISVQTKYKLSNKNSFAFPIQNTSCRTLMARPKEVKPLKILSFSKKNMTVSFIVYRVSEKLGVIRRYYVVADETRFKRESTRPKYSMESLKSSLPKSNNNPFLVVEFSTEYFGTNSTAFITTGSNYLPNLSKSSNTDQILYSPMYFDKSKTYSFFVRACIYNNQNSYPITLDYSKYNMNKSSHPCTDSPWSRSINFNKPFTVTDKVKVKLGKQSAVFTVTIIAVIIGLAIFAIISIAVGCFIKRRRVKRYYNGPQELIMNGDPSLKQALISQNNSAPPAYVPMSHSNGVVDVDSTLKSNYKPNITTTIASNTNGLDLIATGNHIGCTPIPATHLAEYVNTLRQNDNAKFTEEYESIEPTSGTGPQFTWNHSNLEVNKPKNRYANVIAYDHSRVVLSNINDQSGSDYINANYCDGYRRQNAYIATQGPLPETFEAFWRMVWENRSSIIVMMTRLEERQRVKCDQYWPTRGSDHYASIGVTVTHLETVELAYYTLRKFSISRGGRETRDVLQCQFTAWPDPGCPSAEIILPLTILLFVRRVARANSGVTVGGIGSSSTAPVSDDVLLSQTSPGNTVERGPTIVHCSAGVGRTGVYIALDWQLARLQHERAVDVRGCVRALRSHRNYMLQTEEQYRLVYDALLQAVYSTGGGGVAAAVSILSQTAIGSSGNPGGGGTNNSLLGYGSEIPLRHLHAHVTRLQQPLPVLGGGTMIHHQQHHLLQQQHGHPQTAHQTQQFSTGMEIEFNHLSDLSNQRQRQFTSASLPENRLKNRLINILPYENNRVYLQPLRNQDGSDYINASFIDGYRQQKAYIATQGPLANTVADFWRMLWQHNSSIIVMLTQLREMGREKCSQYWPTDRPITFGHIVVEPMVEYNMPSFILREFRVRCHDADLVPTNSGYGNNTSGSPLTCGHRTVRQFQFLDWPEQGVPRSGEGLIDFIGQVHKTKEQFGQEGPITVHCSAGVGRTGVFLALSIVLDRMRSEGTIDLFQTVRLLRMQRPCMVQTEDQYQFCYLTSLEYLSSFDQFLS